MINKYLEDKILNMTREELLIFVYEQIIIGIDDYLKTKDVDIISKSINLITYLDLSLNYDINRELAEQLHNIYLYSIKRLYEGIRDNFDEKIVEIREYFKIILEAWKESLYGVHKENNIVQTTQVKETFVDLQG